MTKNDAIQTLKDHKICFEHDFGWNKPVLDALDAAIETLAADAVPVVRCGECQHWQRDWKPRAAEDGTHFCAMVGLSTSADWFCADGVRKDGDGE